MQERGGKVFLYSFLLIIVTYIVTFIMPMWGVTSLIMGVDESFIDKNIPYFELRDGKFFIEEPIVFSDPAGSTAVYITSDEAFPPEESRRILEDYAQGFIVDSERILIKQAFNEPQEFLWSAFPNTPEGSINRTYLYEIVPVIKTVFVILYIVTFAVYIGIYMFGTLVCTLIGYAFNAAVKAPVGFAQVYKLTAYARTVPIIVKMIFFLLPVSMSLHPAAFYVLFGLYMVWALLAVKKTSENKPDIESSDVRDLPEGN
jgi:hypothetical protein